MLVLHRNQQRFNKLKASANGDDGGSEEEESWNETDEDYSYGSGGIMNYYDCRLDTVDEIQLLKQVLSDIYIRDEELYAYLMIMVRSVDVKNQFEGVLDGIDGLVSAEAKEKER